MSIIHHVLAAATPAQVSRENRIIYSFTFVVSCGWLLMLFLSESFREWHRWLPGGVKVAVLLLLSVLGISAALLH